MPYYLNAIMLFWNFSFWKSPVFFPMMSNLVLPCPRPVIMWVLHSSPFFSMMFLCTSFLSLPTALCGSSLPLFSWKHSASSAHEQAVPECATRTLGFTVDSTKILYFTNNAVGKAKYYKVSGFSWKGKKKATKTEETPPNLQRWRFLRTFFPQDMFQM